MSDERGKQGSGGGNDAGISKEEWLRQNLGQAFDPNGEEMDEGTTKEEYLRKDQSGDSQPGNE